MKWAQSWKWRVESGKLKEESRKLKVEGWRLKAGSRKWEEASWSREREDWPYGILPGGSIFLKFSWWVRAETRIIRKWRILALYYFWRENQIKRTEVFIFRQKFILWIVCIGSFIGTVKYLDQTYRADTAQIVQCIVVDKHCRHRNKETKVYVQYDNKEYIVPISKNTCNNLNFNDVIELYYDETWDEIRTSRKPNRVILFSFLFIFIGTSIFLFKYK